jgi:uncharacterized protein YndB with AHSA1/START domain
MAEIQHELKIRAPGERIIRALSDRDALARWHSAAVTGSGKEEWHLQYPDKTVFRWKVVASSPERVAWQCVEGPGQAAGKEAAFTFSDADGGGTLLEFVHSGWPQANGHYRKCNTLWALLLDRLRQEAEAPANR